MSGGDEWDEDECVCVCVRACVRVCGDSPSSVSPCGFRASVTLQSSGLSASHCRAAETNKMESEKLLHQTSV